MSTDSFVKNEIAYDHTYNVYDHYSYKFRVEVSDIVQVELSGLLRLHAGRRPFWGIDSTTWRIRGLSK